MNAIISLHRHTCRLLMMHTDYLSKSTPMNGVEDMNISSTDNAKYMTDPFVLKEFGNQVSGFDHHDVNFPSVIF